MHYGTIKKSDIANGNGIRVSLFVSGCRNCCKGCFQPETWDFSYGKPFDHEARNYLLELLSEPYINGLSVLGGEPFEKENQADLLPLLKKVTHDFPNKDIWIFTGFTLEELLDDSCRARCEYTDKILNLTDVLVDGRFQEDKKDISLKFRGSSNQRIIDIKKTFETKEISLFCN